MRSGCAVLVKHQKSTSERPVRLVRVLAGVLITLLGIETVWNIEHSRVRADYTLSGIGAQDVVSISADAVDEPPEGTLARVVGRLSPHEILDPLTGFRVVAPAMRRPVEMLQWVEQCRLRNDTKNCRYTPEWHSELVDTGRFEYYFESRGLRNPEAFPARPRVIWPAKEQLGAYSLSAEYLQRLADAAEFASAWVPVLNVDDVGYDGEWLNYAADGENWLCEEAPRLARKDQGEQIGHIRVRYETLEPIRVSLVGQRSGREIAPFEGEDHLPLAGLLPGDRPLSELIAVTAGDEQQNTLLGRLSAWPVLLLGVGLWVPVLVRRTAYGRWYEGGGPVGKGAILVAVTVLTVAVVWVAATL